jgi:hypothetical protein
MQSPVVAILWENWRLSRPEIFWRLALGIVGGAAVMASFAAVAPSKVIKDFGAVIALTLVVAPNLPGWLSFLKLNGGLPGFPFVLLYTRPVRTAVLVGVPLAYVTVAPAAIYLVSVLLLRVTFGYPFPLLPVAAWIAALNLVMATANWSTRNRVVQMLGAMAAGVAWIGLANHRLTGDIDWHDSPDRWPALFDFPFTDYALIVAIGLGSFGLTVAAVARQRRGDGPATVGSWTSGAGLLDRLASLFQFPCPTSSSTRAQVWFELRSRGLPLLTIGAALAMVNLLLFAVSGPIDALLASDLRQYVACRVDGCFWARPLSMFFAMVSVPAVLTLGANAFGIRATQGRLYASAFEATQPYGTGRLAVVKVLVRSVCLLAALTTVVVGMWASGSLIAAGDAFGDPLRSGQRLIEGAIGALTRDQQVALAVVASIGVPVWVASWAALGALWTRYPRRLNIAASLLLLHGAALVLLTLAAPRWNGLEIPLGAILRATSWVAAAAIVFVTAYLAWRTFAERLMTLGQAWGIVLLSATFAAAWLTMLRAAGLSVAERPAADALRMLLPALLPLTIGVLAPWSYSRVRHL